MMSAFASMTGLGKSKCKSSSADITENSNSLPCIEDSKPVIETRLRSTCSQASLRAVICHVCGLSFSKASLPSHQVKCVRQAVRTASRATTPALFGSVKSVSSHSQRRPSGASILNAFQALQVESPTPERAQSCSPSLQRGMYPCLHCQKLHSQATMGSHLKQCKGQSLRDTPTESYNSDSPQVYACDGEASVSASGLYKERVASARHFGGASESSTEALYDVVKPKMYGNELSSKAIVRETLARAISVDVSITDEYERSEKLNAPVRKSAGVSSRSRDSAYRPKYKASPEGRDAWDYETTAESKSSFDSSLSGLDSDTLAFEVTASETPALGSTVPKKGVKRPFLKRSVASKIPSVTENQPKKGSFKREGNGGLASFMASQNENREPCKHCNRKFFADALERHEPICERTVRQGPRKKFDATAHRLQGTEMEKFAGIGGKPYGSRLRRRL